MNPDFTPDEFFKPSMGINWSYISQIDTSDLMLKNNRSKMKIILQDFLNTTNFDGVPSHLAAHLFIILQIIIRTMIKNHKKRDRKLANQIEKNDFLKTQIQELKSDIQSTFNDSIHPNTELIKTINLPPKRKSSVICPICKHSVPSLNQLDIHVFSSHSDLSSVWQILRTPHYPGLTNDPTLKLIAATDEDTNLKQAVQDVEKELLYQQKSYELKIKNYLKKKSLKLNSKLDQMSHELNNNLSDISSDSFNVSQSSSNKGIPSHTVKEDVIQNSGYNPPITNINDNNNNIENDSQVTKDIFYLSSSTTE